MTLTLEDHGAARRHGAAAPFLPGLHAIAADLPSDRAGIRLHGIAALANLLGDQALGNEAARHLGPNARPVRVILFDKTSAANWALGWHQDRTIAVRARADVPGFGPWSVKAGMIHVEPPFALIERMLTIRIHLDAVPDGNAPLLIAPGSHRLGRIAEADLTSVVERCGIATCLADLGDIWVYATPIVHASAASNRLGHRRVLQIDYSADSLPDGLEWLGV
ncbi:phytanoyl-CoA dioxygenase family protein [Sphingomonas sp. JC676]|uniref:phytanoyl-CoA dioxygenase family protein n=1 Tax=Sphingomonas sp. JC676 TaxID=2768065 RepID=UPI0016578F1E|nr:phytanoyl-CoA dioxygenase family protein [Sphingomonas sp. JC676]MBC9034571.1 phytanoyl-CoA dioxygenase family protein [Sphingomonas sp. JC676]